MISSKLISQVEFELSQLDKLFDSYQELFQKALYQPLNNIEIAAMASVIHSFYNGVENIFLLVAKHVDASVPNNGQWHRDLLIQMSKPSEHRQAVISADLLASLSTYLGFKHFFRHSYAFFLDWDKLSPLVVELPIVWQQVKREIQVFIEEKTA